MTWTDRLERWMIPVMAIISFFAIIMIFSLIGIAVWWYL